MKLLKDAVWAADIIYIHSVLFSEYMEIVWLPIHNVTLY